MIKQVIVLAVMGFLLFIPNWAICHQGESDLTWSASFLIGQKFLDDGDWFELDEQVEVGVLLNLGKRSWPVNIAFDILYSWDDFNDVDGDTLELNIGIRKFWDSSRLQPFIGGGLAIIRAKIDFASWIVYDDTGAGIWAECGLRYLITDQFSLGLDLRYSWAEVTLFGEDTNAGGAHAGIILGFHW